MPKIVNTEQYRKELLHKAFDLLAAKGYANVTTREIAKALGISTGAMYHYFPSKRALFEQLVEELWFQDADASRQIADPSAFTLAERIGLLGQFLLDHEDYLVKQTAIWTDFYLNSDPQEVSSNVVFRRVEERYRQLIADVLGLSDRTTTQFILTLVNGILQEQVSGLGTAVFAEQVVMLAQMLLAYFERQAP